LLEVYWAEGWFATAKPNRTNVPSLDIPQGGIQNIEVRGASCFAIGGARKAAQITERGRIPKMLIVVAKAVTSPRRMPEAWEFWNRIAAHMKKQPEVEDCFVMKPLHGLNSTIMMSTHFASLSAWEKHLEKRKGDPEFQAIHKEWLEKEYTVHNTLELSQYTTVS
jgi:hypothetical protein